MAIRNVRTEGDPILRKKAKEVKTISQSILTLLDDMEETMYLEEGVGLAAPQVGALRQVFIVDVGEGVVEFINPEILEQEGEQIGIEGCLSVPGKRGTVCRAAYVKVKALDREGQEFILEAEELMARAILHEYDHLQGTLFIDKVEDDLEDILEDDLEIDDEIDDEIEG